MKKQYFIILGLLFILSSCKTKNINEFDNEIEVINDIFLEIPEHIEFYKIYPPPPKPKLPIEVDEKGNLIVGSQFDSIYRKEVEKARRDTSKVILAFNETLISGVDRIKITEKEYSSLVDSLSLRNKEDCKINLDFITNTGRFVLKSANDFPTGSAIWTTEYPFRFGGHLTLSRIYFNNNRNLAVVYCGYACGGTCGTGNILLLRKSDDRWKIIKRYISWIS